MAVFEQETLYMHQKDTLSFFLKPRGQEKKFTLRAVKVILGTSRPLGYPFISNWRTSAINGRASYSKTFFWAPRLSHKKHMKIVF